MIYRNGILTNIPFWYILKKNQVKMTMPGRQGEGWRLERRWFCGLLRRNKFRIACSGFYFFLNEKSKVRFVGASCVSFVMPFLFPCAKGIPHSLRCPSSPRKIFASQTFCVVFRLYLAFKKRHPVSTGSMQAAYHS